MKFQHIAGAGDAQSPGEDPHITGDEQVSPALGQVPIVGVGVKDSAVRGAEVLRPLVLDMDQRPLPAAEFEMLQPGKLEEIVLLIGHPIRVQETPAGKCASSTVIV